MREDSDNIAFGEFEGKTTDVYVGCVAVIGMPGGFWGTEKYVRDG